MPTLTTRDGEPILVLNAVPVREGGTGARDAATARRNLGITLAALGGVTDHGALTGLVPDDDHTQYFLLIGRAGGTTAIGGTAGADILTLRGNSTTSPLGVRILTADTPSGNALEFKALSAGSAHVTWGQNGNLAITDASAYVGSTPIKFDANVSSVSGNENNPGIRLRRNTVVSAYVRWGGLFSSFSDNLGVQEPAAGTSGASFGARVSGGNTVGPIFGISAGAAAKGFGLNIASVTGGTTRDWTIGDYSLTWPAADAAGILTSNGSGTLSWSTNAAVVDIARSWTTLQTFPDNTIKIVGSAGATKALLFELDGATAGKTATLTSNHTDNRTITLPDATTTLAGLAVINTFTTRQVISVNPGSDRHLWFYDSNNAAYGSFRANLTGGIDRAYETPNSDGTLLVFTDGVSGQQPDAGQLVYGAGPNLPMTAGAALTSGRVPFATTGGVLVDDADMTFATDTLSVTKLKVGGGSSIAKIETGTYTPTRSAEANLDANITPSQAQYVRVGSIVTVSGRFTADPTLAATTTSFEFTLPVASNIGAAEDLAGVAFCGAIAGQGAAITGSVANDTAVFTWKAADVTSQVWSYTFTYEVI